MSCVQEDGKDRLDYLSQEWYPFAKMLPFRYVM